MGLLRWLAETFVTNTSMRGFLKLYRTPHATLRFVWTAYLLSMACLLCSASYFLVKQYAGYFVTVQQSERVQQATPMPAITICSEQPMGDDAMALWSNGSVLSPLQMHAALRRSMRLAYNRSSHATRKFEFYAAKDLFYADKVSTYFQNIHIEDARRIGVQADKLILFCLMKHSRNRNPSVSHDEICSMSVRWIRHPQYMNCYDVTIDPEDSLDVSSVSFILQSGWSPRNATEAAQSHVFDLFTQSKGLRITLHDPGSFPNIDEHSVSVGLHRNTRIRYGIDRYQRLNLGVDHSSCLSSSEVEAKQPLVDFGQNFSYTFSACMSSELGRLVLDKCGCVSHDHMVRGPNISLGDFCHFHNFSVALQLAARLDCVRNIRLPEQITRLRRRTCLHRCEFNRYRVQISSSEWQPTQWQLKLILGLSSQWDVATSKTAKEEDVRSAKRRLADFLERSGGPTHDTVTMSDFELDRLTLVTVQRSSYNTLYKTETLQITLSALLAQVGGLGSLTVGITLTFVFEIFEFGFLVLKRLRRRDGNEQERSKQQAMPLKVKEATCDE